VGCNGSQGAGSQTPAGTPSAQIATPSSRADSPPPVEACDPSANSSPTEFRTGTATLDFTTGDKKTATLDHLGNTTFLARFDPACPGGAQAEWTDSADHWLLTVLANMGPNEAFSGQQATMSIEGYETDPPLYADGSACAITITEVSTARLKGHAECHGLRWLNDYDAQMNPGGARPIPNLAPFDLSVTFEAQP
jgi:hypothetical protein